MSETNYGPERKRYRIEGTDTGGGTCRIVFVALYARDELSVEDSARDYDLELELVRQVEPHAAARIEATAAR